ncbi:MAG: DUF3990 domain-containing protein [Bacteroidales bacterium]|nr:DUF3990 domain-containing protein [Bacteroidales bacterium]
MILFHGSTVPIEKVDLSKSRPNKDFGRAFYLSDNEQQAIAMAGFKALTVGGIRVVTSFAFEDDGTLNIKRFDAYTEDWADFVFNNRDERQNYSHPYDIVYGPIANDTVGVQIRDLRERKISLQTFLENLRYHKGITFQYAFCSPLAISKLIKL